MKTRWLGVLTIGLVLVFAATASAQRQGGGQRGQGGPGGGFGGGFGMMGGGRMALLAIEEVQKELKLTPDQIAAIEKLREEMRPQRGGGPGGAGGAPGGRGRRGAAPGGNNDAQLVTPGRFILTQDQPPGQRRGGGGGQLTEEQRQQFREQAEARQKQEKEKLAAILKPEQMKRLEELVLQRQGSGVLGNAEVAAALGITDEQKERIAKTRQESMEANREQMRELAQGGDREAARAKMTELRKAADDKVYAVLTDAQRKKLDGMLGTPFKFPENAQFGGFGGGRGGAGGPGGGRGNRGGNNNNNN